MIAAFLRARSSGPKIVFTTYQSSPNLATAAQKAPVHFDLAILDEAHKTVGKHSKTFATLLSEKKISIRRRLFMTATERVPRRDSEDVLSMDSEKDYGARFFRLSFKEAIKQGIIADYKVLTLAVSDHRIRNLIDENRILDLNSRNLDEAEAQSLAAGIALKRVYDKQRIKHAISFHRSIRGADRFRDQQDALNWLRPIGPRIQNFHISSKKTAGQRSRLLQEFVGAGRALMTNARCLTEGVDVPAIDCVMFADPKQSRIDIVQAAGRALRKYPGKRCGYIVVPLVVPEDTDFDSFAETTAFRQVAQTITALSTQDERIAEEFRVIEAGRVPRGKIVEIDGDVPIGMKMKLGDFAEAIATRIWDSVGRTNWRSFQDARDFAHSLRFQKSSDWESYARSSNRPPDIPAWPNYIYRNKGWRGWKDWLGGGRTPPIKKVRAFVEARAFARGLKLADFAQWKSFAKSSRRPEDIPTAPWKRYAKEGWTGIDDWLGTSRRPPVRNKRSFKNAREFARGLGLKSQDEWNAYVASGRLPQGIPCDPAHAYRGEGWTRLADWLGLEEKYRPFKEARSFARALKLASAAEWRIYSSSGKRPADIPSAPYKTYERRGWKNWADWLGTEKKKRPFVQARAFARSLRLGSIKEWKAYTESGKLPSDIPARPQDAFAYGKEGWVDYADWLGKKEKRPFSNARAFVRSLRLKSVKDWQTYVDSTRRPSDIPVSPDHV